MTEKEGKTMIDRRRCNQCMHWGKLYAYYGICTIDQRLGQFGPTRKACFRFARIADDSETTSRKNSKPAKKGQKEGDHVN